MGNNDRKIRKDEIWCPECGAPVKKGFFTCSNCRFKIKMTRVINRAQDRETGSGSKARAKERNKKESTPVHEDTDGITKKNPLKKSGHPRYWNL